MINQYNEYNSRYVWQTNAAVRRVEQEREPEPMDVAELPVHEKTARERSADPQQHIQVNMDDMEQDAQKQWEKDRAKIAEFTKRKQDIVAAQSEIHQEQRSLAEYKRSLDSLGWGNGRVKRNLRESITKTEKRLTAAKESFSERFGFPFKNADQEIQRLDMEISQRTPKKKSIREQLEKAKELSAKHNAERAMTRGAKPRDRGGREL